MNAPYNNTKYLSILYKETIFVNKSLHSPFDNNLDKKLYLRVLMTSDNLVKLQICLTNAILFISCRPILKMFIAAKLTQMSSSLKSIIILLN